MTARGRHPVRVLIAGGPVLFVEALCEALSDEPTVDALGACTLPQAPAQAADAEVVLLDGGRPRETVMGAIRSVHKANPGARVLVIAGARDGDLLLAALDAGASGLLIRSGSVEELVQAIRVAHQGETIIPRSMTAELVARLLPRRRSEGDAVRKIARLTDREREILGCLTKGLGGREISEIARISPQTTRTHINNVLRKLGVHSRLEAVALARRSEVALDLLNTHN